MLDVGRLYEAVDDDSALAALCGMIAAAVGGRSASILRFDGRGAAPVALISYWTPALVGRYAEAFAADDPWLRVGDALGVAGRAINCDEHLPQADFLRSRLWNDLFRAEGDDTGRCLGVRASVGSARLAVAVHRPLSARAFGAEEAGRLDAVWPHVERVLRLRTLLGEAREGRRAAEADLDATGAAVVVVDRALRLRRLSAAAAALLDRGDGLRVAHGRLAPADAAAGAALAAAAAAVVDRRASARSALLCPRPSGRRAFRILLLPAGARGDDGALLVIDDPDGGDPAPRRERIAQAYRLTTAEAALAERLLDGLTLKESAQDRGVGLETARTQLQALFAKTGTRRQAELLALLAGLPRAPGRG